MSPQAIFPFVVSPPPQAGVPGTGVLPFFSMARLEQGDTLLADGVPMTVWPTPGSTTEVGAAYDHEGEAPLEYKNLLRFSNVRVYIDDVRYTIVNWSANDFFPHVALQLREMRNMI
jgi:hypothetical protein